MVTPRHLTNAPAREALIDIQFEPPVTTTAVMEFVKLAEPSFVRKLDIHNVVVGLSAQPENQSPQVASIVGARLDTDDPPHVLQVRQSGLTFSRLSPYGEWKDLRDEAFKWWNLFESVVKPGIVTRVAVRYVNEIRIPLPLNDFSEYLVCPPQVPAGLPQSVEGFFSRIVIPVPEAWCTAVITQALESGPMATDEGTTISVLLDIDVFRNVTFGPSAFSEIWKSLDVLREQKNRMFFEHITERTLELFN